MNIDWRTFRSAMLGALAGRAVWYTIVVICLAIGFTPEGWLRSMLPTSWSDIALLILRIVFLALGVAALVVILYRAITGWFPWGKPIPLSQAALKAYDAMKGTMWRLAADQWHGTPAERLDFFATYLAQHAQLLGCTPPSNMLLPIPAEEFRSGTFRNGGDVFRKHFGNTDTYVGMAIARSELRKAIKRMRNAG